MGADESIKRLDSAPLREFCGPGDDRCKQVRREFGVVIPKPPLDAAPTTISISIEVASGPLSIGFTALTRPTNDVDRCAQESRTASGLRSQKAHRKGTPQTRCLFSQRREHPLLVEFLEAGLLVATALDQPHRRDALEHAARIFVHVREAFLGSSDLDRDRRIGTAERLGDRDPLAVKIDLRRQGLLHPASQLVDPEVASRVTGIAEHRDKIPFANALGRDP